MNYKAEWDYSLLLGKDFDQASERAAFAAAIERFESVWRSRMDYLSNPLILKQALDEYADLVAVFGDGGLEGFHLWLQAQKDQTNTDVRALRNTFTEFKDQQLLKVDFFRLNLGMINDKTQQVFLSHVALKEYRHFLERIFTQAKHQLSEPEEKIMTLKAKTSYSNWVEMVSSFLSKEEREVLLPDGTRALRSFSAIDSLLKHEHKTVRDEAARQFNVILAKHRESAEAEINSLLENHRTNCVLRGYTRADQPRHLDDDISTEAVDALLDTVEARFDLSQRYYRLKARLFGVTALEYHERNVPYGKVARAFTFDESAQLVGTVLKGLHSRFGTIFERFLQHGQVDVYPAKGKRAGAFCVWWSARYPTYVMLNHTNTLKDVLTLAHEFGHAINAELSKKQNALQFDTPISFAEVTSTFMEDFVLDELLKDADDELKLALAMMKLDSDVSTIFRQVAGYRFEQALHRLAAEKGYVSLAEIGSLFQKHMAAHLGDSVALSPGSENWWISWTQTHFYKYFYIYSYAFGLLSSKRLQSSVRKDGSFIEHVENIFSAGNSKSPQELFASIGFDITDKRFWNEGLDEFERLLSETEELARKMGKI